MRNVRRLCDGADPYLQRMRALLSTLLFAAFVLVVRVVLDMSGVHRPYKRHGGLHAFVSKLNRVIAGSFAHN